MQQIQNKPDLNSFWRGYEIFHSELYSVSDFDDFKYPFHDIKEVENPTTDGHEDPPKAKVRTYSKKKLTPKYEISFEKDFMKEHKAAFQKHYQNHIESIKLQLSQKKLQSLLQEFFNSQAKESNQSAVGILKTQKTCLSSLEKNQFLKDLQHEQKFNEFLDFIAGYCSEGMAKGFMTIAYKVWMAYVPKQLQELNITEVVDLGQKVASGEVKGALSKHFEQYFAKFKEINEQFSVLIKVFCTTALLTITGYFENPYFSEDGQLNCLKRPWNCGISSDDEESFESWQMVTSSKKRK